MRTVQFFYLLISVMYYSQVLLLLFSGAFDLLNCSHVMSSNYIVLGYYNAIKKLVQLEIN